MKFIYPTWQVPNNIQALSTTRIGGVSQVPFDSLNLGNHVGDEPLAVQQNRKLLHEVAKLPQAPIYLNQIHSTNVVRLPLSEHSDLNADAVYTNQPNQVCLVMTADCLPVLFCSQDGTEIAAAHAGWKGLCYGILETTVAEFKCPANEISVWLAPAISQAAFQVGEEVVEQFCAVDSQARVAFVPDPTTSGKFFGNLYQIANQRLSKLGISNISGGEYCTYTDKENFFSYRREQQTGRMATLIWRQA
ncbi:peptidoglycan editing factor PgeF [Bibersteinia trehalosi]|uniref:Purine nucleoside phosphorylase n=2 Tax=Bibersteinia trehalosi TaxID=47735 RepID=A0A179CYS1_BIBTR|nr:peptidoglycan editing factor PgeF [Bibersteinia trehalosi]OAQ14668.1 polyphenol oxidase [Bibersteinia trehalosi Y31]RRN04626.1 peptidoglycan editing factor PgeF [Bibersteinia trehalosi]